MKSISKKKHLKGKKRSYDRKKDNIKNPINYSLIKEIGIDLPLGIPEHLRDAFNLGKLLGLRKAFDLKKSVKGQIKLHWLITKYFVRMTNINIKVETDFWYWEREGISDLPSDAFEQGILRGLFLGSKYTFKELKALLDNESKYQREYGKGYIFSKYL